MGLGEGDSCVGRTDPDLLRLEKGLGAEKEPWKGCGLRQSCGLRTSVAMAARNRKEKRKEERKKRKKGESKREKKVNSHRKQTIQ